MTLESALQGVVTTLKAAGLTRGDGQKMTVTDCDPLPGQADRPAAITVTFAGISPTDWRVAVRIFIDTNSDVRSAELLARSLTPAVDAALDAIAAPRSEWVKTFSQEFSAYVVQTTLAIGRDDF